MKVSVFACLSITVLVAALVPCHSVHAAEESQKPNIVLVMTDDQGWGQMGYYNHPLLKTPHLDGMAANGLRFDRFYAGAPNCSPTRATLLTGRSNDRTGVLNHGYPLRIQEKTLPQAMQKAGYATGHFGKWHLNGFSGPGVPILKDDPRSPGVFGFDEWLSVTNYFEVDPLMSRNGKFEEFEGDSSEVIVAEALKFIKQQSESNKPFFTVIWYGSPHSPFIASYDDTSSFQDLDDKSKNHYGELVAMDRSIGSLRQGLRDLDVADNTILWFNSDNGGLPRISPDTVGGLRGNKNTIFEGGLRVPCVIEWPAVISQPRITKFPAATMDIFPTLAEIVGMPDSAMFPILDGMSIRKLFNTEIGPRNKPIPFRHRGRAALIDNDYKLLTLDYTTNQFELYNLASNSKETTDLIETEPEVANQMIEAFKIWNKSVESSAAGRDYPEPFDPASNPKHGRWTESEQYKPYVEQFKNRAARRR
jgi:arylsulfatase A-like enzyme